MRNHPANCCCSWAYFISWGCQRNEAFNWFHISPVVENVPDIVLCMIVCTHPFKHSVTVRYMWLVGVGGATWIQVSAGFWWQSPSMGNNKSIWIVTVDKWICCVIKEGTGHFIWWPSSPSWDTHPSVPSCFFSSQHSEQCLKMSVSLFCSSHACNKLPAAYLLPAPTSSSFSCWPLPLTLQALSSFLGEMYHTGSCCGVSALAVDLERSGEIWRDLALSLLIWRDLALSPWLPGPGVSPFLLSRLHCQLSWLH